MASDIPGVRDLIHDGKNGLLFKSNSEHSLVEALNNVLTGKFNLSKLTTDDASYRNFAMLGKEMEDIYSSLLVDSP